MSKLNNASWYDIFGKEISSGRVSNVDLSKGIGE